LPKDKGNPSCPACGSSATLPFENEENSRSAETFSEIILTIFFLFLVVFCILLGLFLSRAGLPVAMVALLAILLFWRRHKESRRAGPQPQQFICLDCNCNFNA
jgi:4-hydroxybenzoate polyprenyltransferase